MKNMVLNTVALLAAVISVPSVRAQSSSIDWFTLDAGGGPSAGGSFSLNGTVGQPDASGAMTGGGYSLTGGFWSLLAVQTRDAPPLTITHTATNTIAVSWPSPSTGFELQVNTNGLGTVNWSSAPGIIRDDSAKKTLIFNPPAGNRFYRLFKP